MKKRIISALLIFAIIFSATTLVASASEAIITSGECGEDLVWNFDSETGTLSIDGSGDMSEYPSNEIPWSKLSDKINSVVVSDGVTSISKYAFISLPNLTNVIIGNSVKSIGTAAFAYSSSLSEITIPDSVTSIAQEAFSYCDILKNITIGSGLKNMDSLSVCYSFELENITVSSQNPYLSSDENGVLFDKDKTVLLVYPCGKTDTYYAIPESVTTISLGAFLCAENLISVKAPDNITSFGEHAFYGCNNLSDFSIPKSTVSIGVYAFCGCNFASIILPETLTTLESMVFESCAKAETVYIPSSLKFIDERVFNYCESITDVYYSGSEEDWNKIEIGLYNDYILNATKHFNHIHSYTEVIETEATCNKSGLKSFLCECGDYYTEVILKKNHANADWEYKADSVFAKTCPDCLEEYDSLTAEIVLDKNEIQLAVNESATLKATVTDGLECGFDFSSADESVAIVDSKGRVSAVGVGQTVVSTNIIGTDLYATCNISVTPSVYNSVWIIDGKETVCRVEEGTKINAPDVPEKNGYVFIGWTPEVPETMPSHDLCFTAQFNCLAKSDKYDVYATFSPNSFNEDITLSVNNITNDREPGGVYMVDGKTYKQIGVYNIKPVNGNGETVQPNEGYTVRIKMAVPDGYKDKTDMVIYHRFVDGGREKLSTADGTLVIENGYMIFEVSKFSEFTILAETAVMTVSKLPNKLNYNYKETLDLSGIQLAITGVDGSVEYVTDTSKMTVEGFDSTKLGTQTVTVKYGNYSCTFEVTVNYSWWQWIIRILLLGFLWY